MGFLDRFFGKKEEEKEQPLEINLGDLEAWLEEKIREREEGAEEELRSVVERVFDARETAKEIVRDISDYEFPDDIKKRVYKPVITSKPAYTKAMLEALGGIGSKKPNTYEETRQFHTAALSAMKTIEKVQLSKGRYLVVTFREEMLKIGSALNSIVDALKTLGEELEAVKKETCSLRSLISRSAELKATLKFVNSPSEEEGKEQRLRKEKSLLEEKYRSLLDSDAYMEYIAAEGRLDEIKKNKSLLCSRVINSLGPFSRSLRKFKKLVKEGEVEYRELNTIDRYLQSPVEAFAAEDKGCRGIQRLLKSLEGAIQVDTLVLGDKEKSKVLSKIKAEEDKLPELWRELYNLGEEERKIETKLNSKVIEEKKALERELSDLESRLKQAEKEKSVKAEEAGRLRAELQKLAAEIQEELEKLEGRKVRVVLPAF